RHRSAFETDQPRLDQPGFVRFRKRGGEYHANNPDPVIKALHASLGLVVETPDEDDDEGKEVSTGGRGRNGKGRFADVPAAPTEDQGRVIVLDPEMRDDSGTLPLPDLVPEAAPVERQAAHLLSVAVHQGRADLYDRFR